MKKRKIVDMFEWYDGPLSYTFRNKIGGQLYYSRLIDFFDGMDVHWTVPVEIETLEKAKSGHVDVRTLMTDLGNNAVPVTIEFGDGTKEILSLKEALKEYEDCLPKQGLKLIDEEFQNIQEELR